MVENKRSDIAKLMTNIVVAWHLSFGHLSNATTVNRFPEKNKSLHLFHLYYNAYLYLLVEQNCIAKSLNS